MFEVRTTPVAELQLPNLRDRDRETEIYPGLNDLIARILETTHSHLILVPTTEETITLSRKEKDIPLMLPTTLKARWKRKAARMKMPLICGGADRLKVLTEYIPAVKDKFAGVIVIDDQIQQLRSASDAINELQLLSHGYLIQPGDNPQKTLGDISTISSLNDVAVLPDKALTTSGMNLVNKNLTDGILYAVGINPL